MKTPLAALIAGVFGSAYLALAFRITTPSTGYAFVGPRAFPIIVGLGILGAALWIWRSPMNFAAPPIDTRRLVAAVGLFALYALLFERVGFLLSTIPTMMLMSRLLGSRSPLRDAIVAAGLTFAIYGMFQTVLHKPLPQGWLG